MTQLGYIWVLYWFYIVLVDKILRFNRNLVNFENWFITLNALNSGTVLNTGNRPLYTKMGHFAAIRPLHTDRPLCRLCYTMMDCFGAFFAFYVHFRNLMHLPYLMQFYVIRLCFGNIIKLEIYVKIGRWVIFWIKREWLKLPGNAGPSC